jgi:hypothetical protein
VLLFPAAAYTWHLAPGWLLAAAVGRAALPLRSELAGLLLVAAGLHVFPWALGGWVSHLSHSR